MEWLKNSTHTVPFWSLFQRIKRTGFGNEELLSVYRDYGVIRKNDRDDNNNRPGSNLNDYQLVERDDLVLNKMKTWQGSLGVSTYRGIVSPAYFVYKPLTDNDNRYLNYVLRSQVHIEFYAAFSKGIRVNQWDLQPEYLNQMPVFVPSLDTQRRIADYLDTETAQIDAMMAKLDEQVELLRERRDAYIRNMFDQYGRSASPLGYHTSIFNGSTPVRSNANYWTDTGGISWFNSSVVNNQRITQPSRFVTELAIRECHLPSVRPGDVLIGITGQGRTRGMVGLLETSGTINQHVASIRPKSNLDSLYLYWCLVSQYQSLRTRSEGAGATKAAITIEDLKSTLIPLPPLDEQRRIVAELDEKTSRIDTMITKCEELKTLLQERRAALITAVVTGQKEVPNHD